MTTTVVRPIQNIKIYRVFDNSYPHYHDCYGYNLLFDLRERS